MVSISLIADLVDVMKIGDKIDLESSSYKDIFLNRLRGISQNKDLDDSSNLDSNILFCIHDKMDDWKVIGTANVDFCINEKKTLSHGKLPDKSVAIGWVKIDNDYRGNKLGKKLLSYIEEKAKETGMKKVYATSVMADAKGFWEKMGYEWSGELRTWMKKL